jgi:hypothetical protein
MLKEILMKKKNGNLSVNCRGAKGLFAEFLVCEQGVKK